jgi:hypothetical protein
MDAAAASGSSGKLPKDESDLAGIDVFLFHLRIGRLVEVAAVRAGHRGIFDDRDRSVGRALGLIAEGARCHEFADGNLGAPCRGLRHRRVGLGPEVIAGAASHSDGRKRGAAHDHVATRDGRAGVFSVLGHGLSSVLERVSPRILRQVATLKRKMWQWETALPRPRALTTV